MTMAPARASIRNALLHGARRLCVAGACVLGTVLVLALPARAQDSVGNAQDVMQICLDGSVPDGGVPDALVAAGWTVVPALLHEGAISDIVMAHIVLLSDKGLAFEDRLAQRGALVGKWLDRVSTQGGVILSRGRETVLVTHSTRDDGATRLDCRYASPANPGIDALFAAYTPDNYDADHLLITELNGRDDASGYQARVIVSRVDHADPGVSTPITDGLLATRIQLPIN
jgi:hypothetical protein